MSEMVERVARAIYEGRNGRGCKPWSLLTQMHKGPYFQDAKDAIRAMREPTEAMVNSPMARCYNTGPFAEKEVRRIFRAMIDAALSDAKGET